MIAYFKLKPKAISEEQLLQSQVNFLKLVDKFSIDLHKRYNEGDFDDAAKNLKLCPEYNNLQDIGANYLVCNQHFLNCWVKETIKNYGLSFESQKDFRGEANSIAPYSKSYLSESSIQEPYGFHITLKDQNNKINLFFSSICDEIKLDQRVYITKAKKEFLWDSYGQNIKIDRYPVSVSEVNWWISFDHEAPKNKYLEDKKEWYKPSRNLSVKEKKDFCAFKGRRILESHIFDAATVLPSITNKPQNKFLKIYPYPWTKNTKDVFAYKAKNTSNLEPLLTFENCQRIFSKECFEKFDFKYYSTNNISWNGLNMILGGFSEYLVNRLDLEQVVKRSSSSLSISAKEHQLVLRSTMQDDDQLVFRCMREE